MPGRIALGRIVGAFGVKGWVKVYSYTEPRDQVVRYSPWILRYGGREEARNVLAGRDQGGGVVASLEGVPDRDAAEALMGAEIEVERGQLPPTAEGEYYWADLEGMEVLTSGGVRLGVLEHFMATGANDVMVIEGERRRLVPFVYGKVVQSVDRERRQIVVDWLPDWDAGD